MLRSLTLSLFGMTALFLTTLPANARVKLQNEKAVKAYNLLHMKESLKTNRLSMALQSGLMYLPTNGRKLTARAESFASTLSIEDDYLPNSSGVTYVEAWELVGVPGQVITITMQSTALDSLLYLDGPGITEVVRNDDYGQGCDAQISYEFLEAGTYKVVASSIMSSQQGAYTLSVVNGAPNLLAAEFECGGIAPNALMGLDAAQRALQMGASMRGNLSPASARVPGIDKPIEAWSFEASANQTVTFTLSSDAFDTYLYVAGPGLGGILEDDDSGGDGNASITITFPQAGRYLIAASAYAETFGDYTIEVTRALDWRTVSVSADHRVSVGSTAQGALTGQEEHIFDGKKLQVWEIQGAPGTVIVDLISADFDSYLYGIDSTSSSPNRNDDDSGGETNAQLVVEIPASGTYKILVAPFDSTETGSFTLRVTRQ